MASGFFKAHRDTPASTDMFGSLIFCLPTEFTGGELIIRSPDLTTSVTHDWGSTSNIRLAAADNTSTSRSHGGLAWAAMYSDCEHEIKPVATGHRVTLTYNLYQPSRGGRSSSQDDSTLAEFEAAASAARESAFGAQLAAALSDATWYPDGVTLGLVLEHFYAVEPIEYALDRQYERRDDSIDLSRHPKGWHYTEDTPSNMPDSIEPRNLKGSDLQLYRAARAFGLDVQIVPVASLDKYKDGDDFQCAAAGPLSLRKLAVYRSFGDDPTGGYQFDPEQYMYGEKAAEGEPAAAEVDAAEEAESTSEEEEELDDAYWDAKWQAAGRKYWPKFLWEHIAEYCAPYINSKLLWIKRPGKQHLKYCGPAREYEGNSGYTTCFYAAAALLLVDVPAVGAPERQG
jgi:hypothetical protein